VEQQYCNCNGFTLNSRVRILLNQLFYARYFVHNFIIFDVLPRSLTSGNPVLQEIYAEVFYGLTNPMY